MAAWNADQSLTTFSEGGYDDVEIHDDSSLGSDVLGTATRYSQQYNSGCYLNPA